MGKVFSHLQSGFSRFVLRLLKKAIDPIFIFLTVIGNSFILISACFFYYLEKGINPKLENFIDALYWAVATITTVGYGDITPITSAGKIYGMLLMLVGTAIFLAYTAFFADALVSKEIQIIEARVRSLDKDVKKLLDHS